MVIEKIILSFAEFSLVRDRIICVDYLNEEPINVEKGILIVETVKKLSNNEPCVVIHSVGDKYIFTTDALRFMASQLTTETHKSLARAIVTTNPASRIAADNFIKSYKPLVATQLFSNIIHAITWASEIVSQER